MFKRISALVALLLALTVFACAQALDLSEITGFWSIYDGDLISLEIREDGSGDLVDMAEDIGIPIQVKEPRSEQYEYAICLGGDEYVNDLSFDADADALFIHDDADQLIRFDRDYWERMPVAYLAPDLSIRYSPEAFDLATDENGALLLTCRLSKGTNDFIHISLVKDMDMATLLDGLSLQSGTDNAMLSYGCWDFSEDEAGSVDYIRNENGTEYDCFFMAIQCGSDCYLVESHNAVKEEFDDDNLSDLFGETMGSIQRHPVK